MVFGILMILAIVQTVFFGAPSAPEAAGPNATPFPTKTARVKKPRGASGKY